MWCGWSWKYIHWKKSMNQDRHLILPKSQSNWKMPWFIAVRWKLCQKAFPAAHFCAWTNLNSSMRGFPKNCQLCFLPQKLGSQQMRPRISNVNKAFYTMCACTTHFSVPQSPKNVTKHGSCLLAFPRWQLASHKSTS